MSIRLAMLLLALWPASTYLASAESTDCTTPVMIIPDGRVTPSTIPQSTTYWFGIYAQANHSYSVEFVPQADNFINLTRPQFGLISVYGPSDYLQACRGNSSVTVTPTSGYAPTISRNSLGAGRRASFLAGTAGLYLISVTNLTGAGTYSFRAVDTTLINMRWNTLGGSDIQWVILNVSDMQITGSIIAIDANGHVVASVPITLPAGGRVSRSSANNDLNFPRNLAGSALFAHNGPPSSIVAEAFMIGPTTTMPERFGAITF